MYPVGIKDREVIDETFDKLHSQDCMSWTVNRTPFLFPVFVVWTILPDGTCKGRPVVDIRRLNQLLQSDVYPLPLQLDIIAAVQGCGYLTVVDCASFFY